jgi:type IV secretory pathway VirD2 relaxase
MRTKPEYPVRPDTKVRALNDENFRLRPRKPKHLAADGTSAAFFALTALAKGLRRAKNPRPKERLGLQRCTVKIRYKSGQSATPWAAHGQYLDRESAEGHNYDSDGNRDIKISTRIDSWQQAGDRRRWHLILSPEIPTGVDLEQLANDVMNRIQSDLKADGVGPLEWVVVIHKKMSKGKEHHHAHVALRGVDKNGKLFRIPPGYIKYGIRRFAQEKLTAEFGYREHEPERGKAPSLHLKIPFLSPQRSK